MHTLAHSIQVLYFSYTVVRHIFIDANVPCNSVIHTGVTLYYSHTIMRHSHAKKNKKKIKKIDFTECRLLSDMQFRFGSIQFHTMRQILHI